MVIDICRPLHVHCIKLYLNNSQKYKNACNVHQLLNYLA